MRRDGKATWRSDSVGGRNESTRWGNLAGRLGETTWRVDLGSELKEVTW